MKFFLVCCMLMVIGCKPAKDVGNFHAVIGTAQNEKYGAVLYADEKIYALAGLVSWDSVYLNKKVKVKGNIKLWKGRNKVEIKNLGVFHAQNYPAYYIVEEAECELYKPGGF